MRNILISFFLLSCLTCKSQIGKTNIDVCKYQYNSTLGKNIYDSVNAPPLYKGDIAALFRYLVNNLQVTSQSEPLKKVTVVFIVDENNLIQLAEIEENKKGDYSESEKDLLTVIKQSENNWIVGKCEGKPVATRVRIPFKISK